VASPDGLATEARDTWRDAFTGPMRQHRTFADAAQIEVGARGRIRPMRLPEAAPHAGGPCPAGTPFTSADALDGLAAPPWVHDAAGPAAGAVVGQAGRDRPSARPRGRAHAGHGAP
jgi:hypothetical protein